MKSTRNWMRILAPVAITLALAVCAQAQTFSYLAVFNGTNGATPSSLIQATDGNLYGATTFGSASESGNIFRVTPDGEVTTVYDFCSKAHCADGQWPRSAPILGSDGNLYGVTSAGGSDFDNGGGNGTAYKLTLGGVLTTLHTFCTASPCSDGDSPFGLVQAADGAFYGTAYSGGQFYDGTLFKITTSGEFTVVHNFCSQANCADGQWPASSPIQGSDGNLYGTTSYGGKADAGVLYQLTSAGSFSVIHTFLCHDTDCARGGDPISVVEDAKGNLYGTTIFGGSYDEGTAFKLSPSHQYTNLYTFTNGNDAVPSGLTLANDGNLYGATEGINGTGTVFQLTPAGSYSALYTFCSACDEGLTPGTSLFQATDGKLYGGTDYYYPNWDGSIYKLSNGLSPLVETVPFIGVSGTSVIILGNGLTGSSSVTFNGVEAAFTVESDTYIKATVPKGATTGTVSVITPSGTLNSNPQFVITK